MRAATKIRVGKKNREREKPLSEEDILGAALQLIRASGVEAFGMRGLAQKLGVSPMAIYYHVPNKEQLIQRVAESLLAGVPTPNPSAAVWEQQMRDHAMAIWDVLSAYPGLSRVVLERPPAKASRHLSLYGLSLLRVAGFDEPTAILCALSFHTYLFGVLSVQARAHRPSKLAAKVKPSRTLAPEDRRLKQHLEQLNPRKAMEFGVETILAGIRSRITKQGAPATARRRAASASPKA